MTLWGVVLSLISLADMYLPFLIFLRLSVQIMKNWKRWKTEALGFNFIWFYFIKLNHCDRIHNMLGFNILRQKGKNGSWSILFYVETPKVPFSWVCFSFLSYITPLALLCLNGRRDSDIKVSAENALKVYYSTFAEDPWKTWLSMAMSLLFDGKAFSCNWPMCELCSHCLPLLMALHYADFGKCFMPQIWL